uniref:Ribosomal protein L36 n=11 Tax=Ulmaceae TaxID=3474 RepID=A0A518QWQ8_ULMAM|nr:ribosomal protein L36 [Ulmus davidiana]YP_009336143.1 ribosomal protein L36 [Ulmus laciniata]YP_009336221.1 ribosomal protein L36 [Ulmus macrocarpa]YP_009336298.1 ribosomal protein L36 [Ulmus pumila]YP_009486159.1 ribosomal protein L36 [Ulmus chenmoui]YP_009488541.1 ribosomal protein L36 [Ulmus gaussenii]YP_009557894.1 ribosomal protein L36 [Zelkova serrata]YP_009686883.1 ribosomal protein L36 [Ulmus americana]YP_009906774.1 ribosomal protein L36 [Ulmus parvifolia]APP88963.1 ribosomal p
MSLFMSWVGTNYYNSSSSTDQSTFFTNFTNGGSYFHICHSLILNFFIGRK